MPPPGKCLDLIFNHIVLPSRLPGQPESAVHNIDRHIAQHTINTTETLLGVSESDCRDIWAGVKRSLELCYAVHANSHIDRFAVMEAFGKMEKGTGIILYIDKQNSGLFMRQVNGSVGSLLAEHNASTKYGKAGMMVLN
jgi:hypothetical protein